ncbi:uncharacterized protein LOC110093507 [Dendrobium catenatum]|uniref:uncharacterized protein LOC110093507 n=1 Tax=Dendrobium catenatum TaxID=906689 RepID=UPI0009F2384B|nr:uncharacterized protein LOC110093507 [Dendrobium catenatum]
MEIISNILINNGQDADQLELMCKFSGKSITALAFKASLEHGIELDLWTCLKKFKLKPKTELFWWRLHNKCIPSNPFLVKRKICINSHCPRGCGVDEDENHLIGGCFKIKNVISIINNWGFMVPIFDNFQRCMDFLLKANGRSNLGANLFCIAVYLVWKSRCKLIHGDKEESDNTLAVNAISMVVSSNFLNIQTGSWDANHLGLLSTWHPPPPGWIKINVDAALKINNMACIGGVARDDKGRFFMDFGEKCWHWDISQLELLAVLHLKNLVRDWMFEAQGVIIEGDNFNIIKLIQNTVKA